MGDHRAEIHITFKIHGKTYKLDLDWVNYFDDGSGVDPRVTEFFDASWHDAKARYEDECERLQREVKAQEREAEERALLERLKKKYES